jgi:urease accessory protein
MTSRRLGRQLLRAARVCWPSPLHAVVARVHADGPHVAVAWGVVGAAAGLDVSDTARVVAHGAVTGPATAAVRLLGLDPFLVHAIVARLSSDIDSVVTSIDPDADELPSWSAPAAEIDAQHHAAWEVRLFAS